ncbi:hypothetical protein CQ018_17290 [Arthrobacter sp. MYb227]|nr:hypothetical protein CQ018_17290 [Arthrobacter sp. MYb227]
MNVKNQSKRNGKRSFSVSRRLVAGAVASSLVILPATSAFAAPADNSEAIGQLIDTNLLKQDLLDAVKSTAGDISDPGPNQKKLALGGIELPLISNGTNNGLLDLGSVGLLSSYAAAPNAQTAKAAAGVLGENGIIKIGSGTSPYDNATIDLTRLLTGLGVSGLSNKVLDEFELSLGAVASTASKSNGKITSDYKLADAELNIGSPLVANLTKTLGKSVNGIGSTLNTAVGTKGVLGSAVNALNVNVNVLGLVKLKTSDVSIGINGLDKALDVVVKDVLQGTVKDKNGLVKIDLKTGDINVDLAKLVKNNPKTGDLNGLAPNTEVLTAATISKITDGVAQALGTVVADLNTALKKALNSVELVITVKANAKALLLAKVNGDVVIKSTLGGLAGVKGAAAPKATTTLTVKVLGIKLSVGKIVEPILNAVLKLVKAPAGLLLNDVLGSVEPTLTKVVNPVLKTLDPVLEKVISKALKVTINEQKNPKATDNESFTVSAVTVTLLPNANTSNTAKVSLATSTVRAKDNASK